MGRAERSTRPHKTSGLEPATTPGGSESEGLSQQKDTSPKGFAEIHGDMPAAAPFPRSQACPDKRRVIFHKKMMMMMMIMMMMIMMIMMMMMRRT